MRGWAVWLLGRVPVRLVRLERVVHCGRDRLGSLVYGLNLVTGLLLLDLHLDGRDVRLPCRPVGVPHVQRHDWLVSNLSMHLDAAEDPYPLLLDAGLKKSLEETLGVGCIIQHRSLWVAWVTAVCDQHQYLSHNETILPIPGDQNAGKVNAG